MGCQKQPPHTYKHTPPSHSTVLKPNVQISKFKRLQTQQVQRLDAEYRALRDGLDRDVGAAGEQAARVRDEVAGLRGAAAAALAEAEERLRAAAAEYEALQR